MIPKSEYLKEGNIPYVTKALLVQYHTTAEVTAFSEWFAGQTGIMAEDGTLGIYSSDYERWCRQGMGTRQRSADWD